MHPGQHAANTAMTMKSAGTPSKQHVIFFAHPELYTAKSTTA
jgi:hypothetical protein